MTVADRIGVMDHGRLMQVAPPAEIYEQPNSRWVADFIGEVNLFEGRLGDDGLTVEGTAAGRLRVVAKADAEPGKVVFVAVRPERVRLVREAPAERSDNCTAGTVVDIGYLGDMSVYKLRLRDGSPAKVALANIGAFAERAIGVGDQVWLTWPPAAAILLTR